MSLSRQSFALELTTLQQRGNTQNTNTNAKTNKLTLVKTQKHTQKPKPKTVHLKELLIPICI